MELIALGWTAVRAAQLPGRGRPARVVSQAGPQVYADAGEGPEPVTVPGRLRTRRAADHPAVGDWVIVEPETGVVLELLPRSSALQRKVPGAASEAQVLAANIDIVLVVAAADNLNLHRVERMLGAGWDSGATPVLVLTKSDLATDAGSLLEKLRGQLPGVNVVGVAALSGEGLDDIRALVPPGRTAVLLGPSGAGKSTLVNALFGAEAAAVGAVRSDGKGRHTTVRRQLHGLPGAGLLVDTPGIRELQLWDETGESVSRAFADIEALALGCRFSNCRHQAEPGCAVQAAVTGGTLSAARLESRQRMEAEVAATARRVDARRRADARRDARVLARSVRRSSKPGSTG
ncbi:MAG: ribosome small subunit-dependent GTPase A [Candidatus Dormibacteria bacterium]